MVLVTACVPQLCRAALARHGLSNAFSPIIFAQELGVEKRDPRFFQTVLERLGAAPEDCTLFEDSPGACKTAREAGIRVVGVYDAFYDAWQDNLKANCHRYIRGFDELLD